MSTALQKFKALASKLSKATTSITEDVASLRAEIESKRKELAKLKNAPVPLAEVEARIEELVRATGERWIRERGRGLLMAEGGLARPDVSKLARLPWSPNEAPPWAAVCAADPEGAITFLRGLVAAIPYEAGAPSSERPAAVVQLEKELAELDETEEQAIDEAAAAGIKIEHRPEVIQRRNREAAKRRAEAERVEAREARQRALDEAHRGSRGGPSPYIEREAARKPFGVP